MSHFAVNEMFSDSLDCEDDTDEIALQVVDSNDCEVVLEDIKLAALKCIKALNARP